MLANQALAKVVGRPIEEIIGKTDGEYYGDNAIGQSLREHDLRVMASGQSEAFEETVPTHYGEVTFLSNKAPYCNASSEVIGIIGISRDITERKRMEEELRTQADLLDRAPVLIFDLDDKVIFWNTGAEEMYGWTTMEAKSKGIHDLLATPVPKAPGRYQSEVMSTGHWKGEVSQLRRDGSRIYVASHWILYMDRQGKPTAILEVNNDITALKKAEEELREARDYLENLIDYANAPVIVWDTSFNITRFNRAFERLTGLGARCSRQTLGGTLP